MYFGYSTIPIQIDGEPKSKMADFLQNFIYQDHIYKLV